MNQRVLGIDGGGSTTVAWLADLTDDGEQVIGRGLAGAANPTASDLETTCRHISEAVESAFEDAKVEPAAVNAACFGVAGTGRAAMRLQLLRWADSQMLAERVKVVHDGEPVLYAAHEDGIGVALIAGTGSLAYGRDASRREVRCGGWGYLLGDEGSGYALAIAGLQAAVRSADGRGPRTGLLTNFLDTLDCTAVSELTEAVYDPCVTRDVIASLARVVLDEAGKQDAVALQLVDHAGQELAEMVRAVVTKLGFAEVAFTLAMTGGVLVHYPMYRDCVIAKLATAGIQPADVQAVEHPVAGSVKLAARMVMRGEG